MEKKKVLRSDIDREVLSKAFKWIREHSHLTQKKVAKRATAYENFGRLLESQISDFERGRTLPSLGTLINVLVACGPDGETLDFNLLQKALIAVTVEGQDGENEENGYEGDLKIEFAALRRELSALRRVISAAVHSAPKLDLPGRE